MSFFLKGAVSSLPWTISLVIESKVALDRVTKYLIAEDIDLGHIRNQVKIDSDTAIKMENGNFYWLTEAEKVLKKKKEEEEKDEDDDEEKTKEDKKKLQVTQKEESEATSQSNEIQLDSEDPQSDLENQKESVLSSESTEYKLILEDINLNIKKGSFVAILGE